MIADFGMGATCPAGTLMDGVVFYAAFIPVLQG